MRIFLFLFIVLSFFQPHAFAQDCSCVESMKTVFNKVESNYISFSEKINKKNVLFLNALKKQLLSDATNKTDLGCYVLMLKYIDYFNDQHVYVSLNYNTINFQDITGYFKKDTSHIMDTAKVWAKIKAKRNPGLPIEGLWRSPSESMLVGVIQNERKKGQYIGVILESKNMYWSVGQVKFILEKTNSGYYSVQYFEYNRRISRTRLNITDSCVGFNMYGVWYRAKSAGESVKMIKSDFPYQFNYLVSLKELAGGHTYLKLPSFDFKYKKSIDSVVGNNLTQLLNSKSLIIDLRNNSGGYVSCYDTLLPFLISHDFIWPSVGVLSTEDNIKFYEELGVSGNVSESVANEIKLIITRMRANINKKVILDSAYTIKKGRYYNPDRKITILVNELTGSSAEYLLLQAKVNPNVKLVGNYSMGVVDNGNVNELSIGCKNFFLAWPTTQVNRSKKYGNTGIAPDILLKCDNLDWLAYVVNIIDK
jgi:hypothetical protein